MVEAAMAAKCMPYELHGLLRQQWVLSRIRCREYLEGLNVPREDALRVFPSVEKNWTVPAQVEILKRPVTLVWLSLCIPIDCQWPSTIAEIAPEAQRLLSHGLRQVRRFSRQPPFSVYCESTSARNTLRRLYKVKLLEPIENTAVSPTAENAARSGALGVVIARGEFNVQYLRNYILSSWDGTGQIYIDWLVWKAYLLYRNTMQILGEGWQDLAENSVYENDNGLVGTDTPYIDLTQGVQSRPASEVQELASCRDIVLRVSKTSRLPDNWRTAIATLSCTQGGVNAVVANVQNALAACMTSGLDISTLAVPPNVGTDIIDEWVFA